MKFSLEVRQICAPRSATLVCFHTHFLRSASSWIILLGSWREIAFLHNSIQHDIIILWSSRKHELTFVNTHFKLITLVDVFEPNAYQCFSYTDAILAVQHSSSRTNKQHKLNAYSIMFGTEKHYLGSSLKPLLSS